jgi:LemA protein
MMTFLFSLGLALLSASLLLSLLAVWLYNRLVRLRNLCEEAAAGVDVQLKRRHDLVPKLVEVVKGYAGYERSVVQTVAELRGQAMAQAGALKGREGAENALSQGLGRLLAVAEAYPELKAGEQFLLLQRQLSAVEDEIQMSRRYYNGTVRDLNTACQSFPDLLLARALGFRAGAFFELASSAEAADPQVRL